MILGIVGTHGAGKGAVVQFLEEHGFIHCSARSLIVEEMERRGLPLERIGMGEVGNELRATYGPDVIVQRYLERYNPETEDVVIESIYTLGEADAIRRAGGYIIAVDADPEVRYERIKRRMSETDLVSKEQFLARQEQELHSEDPAKLNSRAVMDGADFHIENDGDLIELNIQVRAILEKIAEG